MDPGTIRVARAEEVMERQPTRPERLSDQAARVQARCPNLHPADVLTIATTISYDFQGRAAAGSGDERGETSGLNSGEVLATLLDLGMEGIIRQLPEASFLRSGG